MAKAKYDTAQLEAMLAKGEAFKNADGEPSFPIADEADLKDAIRAVGRAGADHDAVRKYIVGRAKALKLEELIPDNWNDDGSLADEHKAAPTVWAKRAQGMTYNDAAQAVSAAIQESLPASVTGDDRYVWVVDMTDAWAVYELGFGEGPLRQVPYTIGDDGAVTLGDAVEVARKTTYEALPASAPAAGGRSALPAVPKRAFTSLVEQPPAQPAQVQVRMDAGDSMVATFRGYASTTGDAYAVHDWLGEYRETISPGAFAKTLREQEAIPLLFNHDGMPLASTASGTSRLSEDHRGLANEADLDRRQALTNDLCIALERGDVSKMSFSFRAIKDGWNDAYDERSVSELALYDTSIVTYPANPNTTAELRGAMRSVLGREGISVMWSARSALTAAGDGRLEEAAEPVFEQAMRALAAADERLCRQFGQHGRARTFLVARLMMQVREGKRNSEADEQLLRAALEALHAADDHLTGIDAALDQGQAAISQVLGVTNPDGDPDDPDDGGKPGGTNNSGLDGDQGGGSGGGNPVSPPDGAGPRSATPPGIARAEALLASINGGRR